jgi:hypothetical protein
MELVIGAAVMCDNKAAFITNIFHLSLSAQAVLKGLVEAEDEAVGGGLIPTGSSPKGNAGKLRSGSEDESAGEIVKHLQIERTRLLQEVEKYQLETFTLKQQIIKLREVSAQNQNERDAISGNNSVRENTIARLSNDLDCLRSDYDIQSLECTNLKAENKAALQRLEASREMQAKLEMENRQQMDELDIARDKVGRLAKAEQTVEKYQRKASNFNISLMGILSCGDII